MEKTTWFEAVGSGTSSVKPQRRKGRQQGKANGRGHRVETRGVGVGWPLEVSVGQTMAAGVSPLPSWRPGYQGLSVLPSTSLLHVLPPLHGRTPSERCCSDRRGQTPREQLPSPWNWAGTQGQGQTHWVPGPVLGPHVQWRLRLRARAGLRVYHHPMRSHRQRVSRPVLSAHSSP